jgi:cytochrome b
MTGQKQGQLVWDVPTRMFHWLLVGLLGFSWWSAETDRMDWHQYSGLTICGLIVFRILWGFVGTSTARFTQFVKGPRVVWSYLRSIDTPKHSAISGHNPVGGWSVVALLLMACAQFVSGLFAIDIDGIESGPLSYLIDFDQARTAARFHEASFNFLMALVAGHVAAVLFYLLVKRRNLIGAMITGFQPSHPGNGAQTPATLVPRWRLPAAVLVSALLAYGVANGFRF